MVPFQICSKSLIPCRILVAMVTDGEIVKIYLAQSLDIKYEASVVGFISCVALSLVIVLFTDHTH